MVFSSSRMLPGHWDEWSNRSMASEARLIFDIAEPERRTPRGSDSASGRISSGRSRSGGKAVLARH